MSTLHEVHDWPRYPPGPGTETCSCGAMRITQESGCRQVVTYRWPGGPEQVELAHGDHHANVDAILDCFGVLLAVANTDALRDNPRRASVDNARRELCRLLGIQRLDTPVDKIKALMREALLG